MFVVQFSNHIQQTLLTLVCRVHWLHARAQLSNRWQEQLTLTSYKMEWMVRYFLYMKEKWVVKSGAGCSTSTASGSPVMSPSSLAYWKKKNAV